MWRKFENGVWTMVSRDKTLIDELMEIPGKAEIINGEIVRMSPTGRKPNRAAGRVYISLVEYEERTGSGVAATDGAGFLVSLPNRQSFSPDSAYYIGPDSDMRFFEGAPVFAVEVRSENDYGPGAEREIAQKRADYFAAGTLVVWDVDLMYDEAVYVYRASDPATPTVYKRGEIAEAEPAVPGWSMPVDDLFIDEVTTSS
jgi:Uma2 family endonuclease